MDLVEWNFPVFELCFASDFFQIPQLTENLPRARRYLLGWAGWPDPGCSQLRMRWQEAVRCGGGEKGRKDVSTEFSDDDNSYFMERRYVFKTLG